MVIGGWIAFSDLQTVSENVARVVSAQESANKNANKSLLE